MPGSCHEPAREPVIWARRPHRAVPDAAARRSGIGGVPEVPGAGAARRRSSIWSATSVRTVNTKCSAKQFARGHRWRDLHHRRSPRRPRPRSKCNPANLPARSRTRNRNRAACSPRSMTRLWGLLGGPAPVGMSGAAEHVQVAVADLEHEQHVEPPQGERTADVEEVDREHAGGLGAKELPPAGVGVPDRRRWDATDGRGADGGRA